MKKTSKLFGPNMTLAELLKVIKKVGPTRESQKIAYEILMKKARNPSASELKLILQIDDVIQEKNMLGYTKKYKEYLTDVSNKNKTDAVQSFAKDIYLPAQTNHIELRDRYLKAESWKTLDKGKDGYGLLVKYLSKELPVNKRVEQLQNEVLTLKTEYDQLRKYPDDAKLSRMGRSPQTAVRDDAYGQIVDYMYPKHEALNGLFCKLIQTRYELAKAYGDYRNYNEISLRNESPGMPASIIKEAKKLAGIAKTVTKKKIGRFKITDWSVPLFSKFDKSDEILLPEEALAQLSKITKSIPELSKSVGKMIRGERFDIDNSDRKAPGSSMLVMPGELPFVKMKGVQPVNGVVTLGHESTHAMHGLVSYENRDFYQGSNIIEFLYFSELGPYLVEIMMIENSDKVLFESSDERDNFLKDNIMSRVQTAGWAGVLAHYEMACNDLVAKQSGKFSSDDADRLWRKSIKFFYGETGWSEQEIQVRRHIQRQLYKGGYMYEYAKAFLGVLYIFGETQIVIPKKLDSGFVGKFLKVICSKINRRRRKKTFKKIFEVMKLGWQPDVDLIELAGVKFGKTDTQKILDFLES